MNNNKIFYVAGLIVVILLAAGMLAFLGVPYVQAGAGAQGSKNLATHELILQALETGQIDADTANLYLAYALGDYQKLPQEYRSDAPWEGTWTLLNLTEALRAQSAGRYRNEIAEIIAAKGSCSNSTASLPNEGSSVHFYIEYGTIGGGLSISSYSTSLETAWTKEITQFGWAAPPVFASNPPPGNLYHVRIDNLGGGLYGFVSSSGVHAGLVGNNPNTVWNDVDAYASCMVLNSDFSGFPGSAQQALDATTAHEFNHSIQYGYGALVGSNRPAQIFVEGGATWMEDEVFDAANDNYNYLWPNFAMAMGNYTSSPYPYWITFRGLTERYGTGSASGGEQVMQDFWETLSKGTSGDGIIALNTALANRGTNLGDAFHAYGIAVKFNKTCGGSFVYPYCFEEGSSYVGAAGATPVNGTIASIGNNYSGSLADSFAINWVALPTGSNSYRVTLQNTSAGGSLRGSIVCETGSALNVTALPAVAGAGASTVLSNFNPSGCTRVVAVLTNQSNGTASTARTYTLSTVGAINPPGAATLVSPNGAITNTTPTYTWNKVNASTWYYLWVNNPAGTPVIQQWYQSSAVCGASTCSVTPSVTLSGGNHQWWIQTWNDGGYGPWSSAMNFSVGTVAPPGAATLVSPNGAITDTTPTYTWNKVNASTWYYLWVNNPAGTPVIQQWYESSAVCGASTCSVTPSVTLSGGNHQWWILTWNDAGYGPWSNARNFSLPASGFNSQFNGTSTGWQAHSGSWGIDSSQWYTTLGLPSAYTSASYNNTFSTLDYQARLWRTGAFASCLVIRGSPNPLAIDNDWDSGYSFCYTIGGIYSVWKSTGGSAWSSLQPWTVSAAIPIGEAWNDFRVIANGSNLYFYCNGALVWSGVDASLTSGRVGIEFYSPNPVAGNQLWVDWATLTDVAPRENLGTISPEQQALNEAAREGTGNKNYSPIGE
jgi:hypothetical protein